ncbi:MAG TPA: thermonuclease family protein [Anaerolineae bacterium]|nr:thermonuclease family protein [Anaerolineae bacterium]
MKSIALALLIVVLLLAACSPAAFFSPEPDLSEEEQPAGRVRARVVDVVDGDTIKVTLDGETYTLRYIGIDTPETVRPNTPVEWMGPEASAANKALVLGETVYLEKDVSETDRYGRLLRYVYLADGTFVNGELVRQGYAYASTYPPDVKYQDLLSEMQREAVNAGRGLWGPAPTPTGQPVAWLTGTPTPAPAGANILIVTVDKRAEFVDIQNVGSTAQDLAGWVLLSEKGNQVCPLSGTIAPGATLRIWAMAQDSGQGGYNCGFDENIWNNSESDPAVLYDAQGREVARK